VVDVVGAGLGRDAGWCGWRVWAVSLDLRGKGLGLTEEFGGDVVHEADGCVHELA